MAEKAEHNHAGIDPRAQDETNGGMSNKKLEEPTKPSNSGKKGGLDKPKEKATGDKSPPGGFDDTAVPKAPPGFTLKLTIHRANSLPTADINDLSSDPFVVTELTAALPSRHKEDPPLRFRTPTVRRNRDPVWNATWIIANVPRSGFKLKLRIYDEDPADHDDRLGNAHLAVGELNESWPGLHEEALKIKKRMGSKRAYLLTGCMAMFSRKVHLNGTLVVSAEVLGITEGHGGKVYTIGPQYWSQHLSPLIGRLTGTKVPGKEGKAQRYNFEANQIQLRGPIPDQLYHRYVEFKPFIKGMFRRAGLRGRILNRALHHQHARVYNFDRTTAYGVFPSPSEDVTLQFLDMVHYDQGGRVFTYVLMLDGLFRFTETGKEFGIDLLSKHSMHSDVSIYIAWSGEFFVRRLKHPHRSPSDPSQESHPPSELPDGPPNQDPPRDPTRYELIIDNDSGTYRPNGDYLHLLRQVFETNFPGLAVRALACDDEHLKKMKEEQRKLKKAEGEPRTFVQTSSGGSINGSISSSDADNLEERARLEEDENVGRDGAGKETRKEKGLKMVAEPKDYLQRRLGKGDAQDTSGAVTDEQGREASLA